ncbi:DMT family transporter [Labrenzia aggregata]|uniref:DMT family transporter n=2 Tax=Roseibium aggregatum TaxID=187304 RepID=A0A926NUE4_9HYPH|nr:DMT family transporter [Roseibium aggregatum]
MCTAVAFLCVSDAIAKTLTAGYSPLQILFLRNVIALPFAVLIAWKAGGVAALRSHRPAMHLFRGLIWIGAAGSFFTGLKYLGLAEATVLAFAAPVFITALAALVLKDPVGWRRWSAVLVGFVGVLVVVRPGLAAFQMVSLFPVATAVLYAVLMLSARFVDPRESVWTLMLYLVGAGAVISALTMPFVWVAVRPQDIWLFLGVAFFGTIGVTMLTQAFRLAPAATVAPLDYTALIWATLIGWLVWGEIPDLPTYLGAAIIIASGIFIIWRERKLEE